jgi:hypothetical protein
MNPTELSIRKKAFIEQSKSKHAWAVLSMFGNPIFDSQLDHDLGSNENEFEKMAEKE